MGASWFVARIGGAKGCVVRHGIDLSARAMLASVSVRGRCDNGPDLGMPRGLMTLQFGWWDHFEQRSDMPLWQQYDERIELIRHAEELGFYGYHIAEHHFTTLDMAPSPIVFLAAVARRTTKIRLGTMVLCLPLYHPTRLVQEFCMIDQLSHGRFMPGVGRGVRDVEHEWFGSDSRPDARRVRRGAVDRAAGSEHRAHHASRRALPVRRRAGAFRDGAEAVSALLVCRQSAARGGAGDERARPHDARDGRSSTGRSGRRDARARIRASWATIRWSARRGTSSWPIPTPRRCRSHAAHSSPTPSISIATEVAGRWRRCRIPARCREPGGINVDAMIEAGHVLAGSAATVRDRLRRFVDAVGPKHNYLCAAFQWGDLTTEEARRSLDLFAAEVKPALEQI